MNPRIIGRRVDDGPRHARGPRAQDDRARHAPRTTVGFHRRVVGLVALLAIPTAATLTDVADHPLAAPEDATHAWAMPTTPEAPPGGETAPDDEPTVTTVQVTAAAGETVWSIAERTATAPGVIVRHNSIAALADAGDEATTDAAALASGRPFERTQTLVVPATAVRDDANAPSEPQPTSARAPESPRVAALAPVFDRWADHFGVPHDLLKALAWVESGWDNETRSAGGGIGIGRLQPARAQYLAAHVAGMPLDPEVEVDNIALTAAQLRVLLDETPDVPSAIAAHRQGIIETRLSGVDPMLHGYVEAVLAARARFA